MGSLGNKAVESGLIIVVIMNADHCDLTTSLYSPPGILLKDIGSSEAWLDKGLRIAL
jgi:hypothetical protein